MEYDNRPQIASILGEIEYIIELLYNAYNGPARNTLIERLRNLIRSMAELAAFPTLRESAREDVEPQADGPPAQPAALRSPAVIGQESVRLTQGKKRLFTHEELALYNGTGGYPSYVAVNGIVYDVTNAPIFQTLTHFGLPPGRDLSVEFNTCHSDKPSVLDAIVPVGRLQSGDETLI